MCGSDAMALSMIVSMFDLAHTYMEPMETAIGGINASGLTNSPQHCHNPPRSEVELPGGQSQLNHYWAWIEVVTLALPMIVSIPDLVYVYMEPMETATSNLHASCLTYSPQHCHILPIVDVDLPGGPSQLSSHYWAWIEVVTLALSMIVSIPDLVYTYT